VRYSEGVSARERDNNGASFRGYDDGRDRGGMVGGYRGGREGGYETGRDVGYGSGRDAVVYRGSREAGGYGGGRDTGYWEAERDVGGGRGDVVYAGPPVREQVSEPYVRGREDYDERRDYGRTGDRPRVDYDERKFEQISYLLKL